MSIVKRQGKNLKLTRQYIFKILSTCSAFIDLEAPGRPIEILNTIDASKSFEDINKQMDDDLLNYLSEYFKIQSGLIDPNTRPSLYMPYLPRIRDALKYIKERKPQKYERFQALIKATLENRFLDFIENEKQSDEQGLAIAGHNRSVRGDLLKAGINVDRWLGKSGQRMPEGFFMYYEKFSPDYDPISDARSVEDYLQRTLNARITDEQRNTLGDYLQSIGLVANLDSQGNVTGLKVVNAGKKKDVVAVVSERSHIERLLKLQQELLKADNVRQTASLLEIVTHWGERIQILKDRLNNSDYQKEFDKHRQHFQIRPILRNPGHDLFIGDFTNCCLGMNSGQDPDAMMERLIDEGLNVIEVIDESTQKTMAAAWVYIAQDGSFVIQNMEINVGYERTTPLMNRVGESMIDYARQFAVYIGAKRLLIGEAGHGKYFGPGGFIDMRYGEKTVAYGLDKIGGYLGEKYFLDSAGKATAYLVGNITRDNARLADRAMKANNGGIDLTQAGSYLTTQNFGPGIKFHLDPAQLARLQNAPGFVPMIIDMQPLKDLTEFLELNDYGPHA